LKKNSNTSCKSLRDDAKHRAFLNVGRYFLNFSPNLFRGTPLSSVKSYVRRQAKRTNCQTEGSGNSHHRAAQSAAIRGPARRADELRTSATICGDVLQAAHRETEHIDAALRTMRPDLKPRVEAMLGVISYCYAKGLFDSAEIERRLWQDKRFLATFGNEIPSAQSIRSFRRSHRENILAIIEQALSQCRQRTSQPATRFGESSRRGTGL
jgi:hypothetical protein